MYQLCEPFQLVISLAVVSLAYKILRRFLPGDKVEAVKGLTITADGNGVVFDVPAEDLDTYLAGREICLNHH